MATAPKPAAKTPNLQAVPAGDDGSAATPARKSSKKLVLITALATLLLAGGGAAAWYFLAGDKPAKDAVAKKEVAPAAPPVFMVMDQFTVNLQNEGLVAEQFLQVAFTLQVPDQTQVDRIKLYMPQVRSHLLLLLSGKRASEISTPEGKNKLATEIAELVNKPFAPGLPAQKVSGVFFTSFVVQ